MATPVKPDSTDPTEVGHEEDWEDWEVDDDGDVEMNSFTR